MKLLLVEDDRIVRIPVRDRLQAAGFAVTECADGPAALRAAELEAQDIVLSDVRLPGMDGIALFRKLRQLQPDVAVLLMTAHAATDDAVAVMREGARDYIQKPTSSAPTPLIPEGFLVMSKIDADRLGLRDGERVRVSSASNPDGAWDVKAGAPVPIVGKLKVVQGIRPGVVAFPLGFGHWASGARDVVIDGQKVKGDPRRAAPFHANAAMRVDPHLKNVTLSDLAGGSAVFYDTKVKVVRA